MQKTEGSPSLSLSSSLPWLQHVIHCHFSCCQAASCIGSCFKFCTFSPCTLFDKTYVRQKTDSSNAVLMMVFFVVLSNPLLCLHAKNHKEK
jgi:hypothetical protein